MLDIHTYIYSHIYVYTCLYLYIITLLYSLSFYSMSVVIFPTAINEVCFLCLMPFGSRLELFAHFFSVGHNYETLKLCGVDLLMCLLCGVLVGVSCDEHTACAQHQLNLLQSPDPLAPCYHIRSHPLPARVTNAQLACMFEPEANAFYRNHREVHWEWFLWREAGFTPSDEDSDDEEEER